MNKIERIVIVIKKKGKNHFLVDGRLLQMNKKFSHLKSTQQERSNQLLKEEYLKIVATTKKPLTKIQKEHVLDTAYNKICENGTWIPYDEVRQYFIRKLHKWNMKYIKKEK